MKNLKKTAAVLTAAALTMSMGISAYAENDITGIGESASQTVTGSYSFGENEVKVYRVDITWNRMDYTFYANTNGVWNPDTHTYDGGDGPAWGNDAGLPYVELTNHSNAKLKATVSFTKDPRITGDIKAGFVASDTDDNTIHENSIDRILEDASVVAPGKFENAPTAINLLIMDGIPDFFEPGALGQVTVAISDAE